MKHSILRYLALTLCITAGLLGFVLTASAEESEVIINNEHSVDMNISTKNHSYVYLTAEVPSGWGGNIKTRFHSLSSGKDYTVTMNYIQDEYNSGIWLPFGQYSVTVSIPDEDGMCLVHMIDESQSRIHVKEGEDSQIFYSVTENPDFEFSEHPLDNQITPPAEKEDYTDLPTVIPDAEITEEETISFSSTESVPTRGSRTGAMAIAIILVTIVIICVGFVFFLEYKHNKY